MVSSGRMHKLCAMIKGIAVYGVNEHARAEQEHSLWQTRWHNNRNFHSPT